MFRGTVRSPSETGATDMHNPEAEISSVKCLLLTEVWSRLFVNLVLWSSLQKNSWLFAMIVEVTKKGTGTNPRIRSLAIASAIDGKVEPKEEEGFMHYLQASMDTLELLGLQGNQFGLYKLKLNMILTIFVWLNHITSPNSVQWWHSWDKQICAKIAIKFLHGFAFGLYFWMSRIIASSLEAGQDSTLYCSGSLNSQVHA